MLSCSTYLKKSLYIVILSHVNAICLAEISLLFIFAATVLLVHEAVWTLVIFFNPMDWPSTYCVPKSVKFQIVNRYGNINWKAIIIEVNLIIFQPNSMGSLALSFYGLLSTPPPPKFGDFSSKAPPGAPWCCGKF